MSTWKAFLASEALASGVKSSAPLSPRSRLCCFVRCEDHKSEKSNGKKWLRNNQHPSYKVSSGSAASR